MNKDEDDEMKFNELIDLLESTIWKWHQDSNSNYEFLTCLATLSLFKFNLEEFSFNDNLQGKDIENISALLRENFNEINTLKKTNKKQAFVLNIALNNPFEKTKVVQYVLKNLKDKICTNFTDCTGDQFDLMKLHKIVEGMLAKKDSPKAFKEKQRSLSMHFTSIFSRTISPSNIKQENYEANEAVQSLLKDLGLVDYFPQKLGYGDVIKLTEDAFKDVNEKPSTLPELPWYFLRRLIGLESTIREKGSVVGLKSKTEDRRAKFKDNEFSEEESDFSWDDDSSGGDTEDEEHKHQGRDGDNIRHYVHPLDLIYIIFLCADDFLRQELADKMSKCQYAVPFILPPPAENGDESQNIILRWGLQTISRTYCEEKGPVITKNLQKLCCPVISCMSLNTNTTWKSRLLNKMLSPQQETF